MAIRSDDGKPREEMEFRTRFIDFTHIPTVDGEE
jgi:hypothetical protein